MRLVFIMKTHRIKWCITHKCVTLAACVLVQTNNIRTSLTHSSYTHSQFKYIGINSKRNNTCTWQQQHSAEGTLRFLDMCIFRCSLVRLPNIFMSECKLQWRISVKLVIKKQHMKMFQLNQKWLDYVTILQINFLSRSNMKMSEFYVFFIIDLNGIFFPTLIWYAKIAGDKLNGRIKKRF